MMLKCRELLEVSFTADFRRRCKVRCSVFENRR